MATLILRPIAAGDETNISSQWPWASGDHWDKVDEVTPDEFDTYIWSSAISYLRDLYNLEDTSQVRTINWIKVWIRSSYILGSSYAKTAIKTGGVAYNGEEIVLTAAWVNYSTQYITNPQAGGAWTWTQINALQAGVSLHGIPENSWAACCTQVWIEVDYTSLQYTRTQTNLLSLISKRIKGITKDRKVQIRLISKYQKGISKTRRIVKNQTLLKSIRRRKINLGKILNNKIYLKIKKIKMQILKKIKKLIQLITKKPKKTLGKLLKIRIKLITESLKLKIQKVNRVNLLLTSTIKRNIKLKLDFLFNVLLKVLRFKFESTKIKNIWVLIKLRSSISKKFYIHVIVSTVILLISNFSKNIFTKLYSKILLILKKITSKEKVIRNNLLLIQQFFNKKLFIRRNSIILNNLSLLTRNIFMIRSNLLVSNLVNLINRQIMVVKRFMVRIFIPLIVMSFYILIERTFKPIINLISSSISYYADISGKRILKFIRDRKNTKIWRKITGDYD